MSSAQGADLGSTAHGWLDTLFPEAPTPAAWPPRSSEPLECCPQPLHPPARRPPTRRPLSLPVLSCISWFCRSTETRFSAHLAPLPSGCPINATGLTSSLSPGPKPEGSAPSAPASSLPSPLPGPPSALNSSSSCLCFLSSLCLWPPRPSCCHGLALVLCLWFMLHTAASVVSFKQTGGCQARVCPNTIGWLPGVVLSKHDSSSPARLRGLEWPGLWCWVAGCTQANPQCSSHLGPHTDLPASKVSGSQAP